MQTGPATNKGTLGDFTLILHGTKEIPQYRKNGARFYNDEYNRSRKMVKEKIKSFFLLISVSCKQLFSRFKKINCVLILTKFYFS